MKIRYPALLRLALIGAAAFALSPLLLSGQTPSPASTDTKGVVHIPAGRLEDVLKFLNEKFPAGKFVATPNVLSLQVGDVLVSGANGSAPSLNDVAKAVTRACDPLTVNDPDSTRPDFVFTAISMPESLAALFNAANAVEAFNLEDTVADNSDHDKFWRARSNRVVLVENMVRGAINTIREEGRVPVSEAPRLQFNPSANVLVVIGNSDVLGITRKIVDAVNASARGGMAAKASAAATPAGKPASDAPAPGPNH